MEAYAYFPAIVYRDERPDLVEQVLPICIQALDQVRQPGWVATQSAYLGAIPAMQGVSDYVLHSAVNILRSQGYDVDKYEFHVAGLWAQEFIGSTATNVHVHKNSQICGWMFLEAPAGGAYPLYHDSRANKAMVELDFIQGNEITNATNLINFNNVIPGTVLFNNSWMNHQIVGGSSQNPTRCVHFIVSHKEVSTQCSM